MPRVNVTYKDYVKNDLDSKIEKFVGKLIVKKGFGKNGNRVLSFDFLSEKAAYTIADKLRLRTEVVDVTIED